MSRGIYNRKLARANKGMFQKGEIAWNKGKSNWWCKDKPRSPETREKISKSHKGMKKPWVNNKWRIGKKVSKETKRKMSLSRGGTGIPQRTTKRYYHPWNKKYIDWRSKVLERDNWTCQTCRERGCYLEPHHIKGWSKYPQLRYEVENGVTLCRECHRLTRKNH